MTMKSMSQFGNQYLRKVEIITDGVVTKIVNGNNLAYQNATHFVWNIPIKDPKPFIEEEDYKSNKPQSMMDEFRQMSPATN